MATCLFADAEFWDESEARRRIAKRLPAPTRFQYIGQPIADVAQGLARQAAMPPGQPERAQPEALDTIRKHERQHRTSGGDCASTQFIRDTIAMHGGATLETAYQAVIAAIEGDISGAGTVFFSKAGDGYIFRRYNGSQDKVTHSQLRIRVKRLWAQEQTKRVA